MIADARIRRTVMEKDGLLRLVFAGRMENETEKGEAGGGNLWLEAAAAAAMLSRWTLLSDRSFGDAEQRARATVFLPVIGFAAGVTFAVIDRGLGAILGPAARSLVIVLIMAAAGGAIDAFGIADLFDAIRIGSRPASTGLARIGPLGAIAALAWCVLEVWLLSRILDPEGRSGALVMATMLSRWSMVPIAYGLRPLERWGLGVPYQGGIKFREFAASSAVALGLTMGLYENVGLAVIVALALTILALRLALSRRLGGAAGYALAGGAALCELVVFATLAALGV